MHRIFEIVNTLGAQTRVVGSIFKPQNGARGEIHAILEPFGSRAKDFDTVARQLRGGLDEFVKTHSGYNPVFVRIFLSDIANQAEAVDKYFFNVNCALSIIGQPPLSSRIKMTVLVIMAENVEVSPIGDFSYAVGRGAYRDILSVVPTSPGKDSYEATSAMFERLATVLTLNDMTIADNCLRTWFYVRDIDNRYGGMVAARNEFFARCGMTPETHFIASTGIEGSNRKSNEVVSMDALSIRGLGLEQIKYINAPTHLNPTAQYGVAFERATAVDYGDRRHLIVSGTASIDNKGEIVAPGDIAGQCHRMMDNVEALLSQAGASGEDLAHIIVYVRDIADGTEVALKIAARYPHVPCVVVQAAVCRPGWLVEMECMAIVSANNPDYAAY